MANKDYYKILGISKDAEPSEIKKAYQKKARKYHPDVNKSEDAEEKFKEINEAFQVLSDPQKRQAYDRFGTDAFSGAGGFGQGQGPFNQGGQRGPFSYTYSGSGNFTEDLGDIFDMFFGGGFGRQRKGQDVVYTMTIDFAEAIKGGEKQVQVQGKKLKVKIPKGARTGTKIKFAGEGQAGPNGTPPGDLFVVLQVKPHPQFYRRGDNLYLQKKISMYQAALGDVVNVPSIEEGEKDGIKSVKLKIPAGTQPGDEFRLKGKGMPRYRRRGQGDLFVKVKVEIPEKLSRTEKKALEKLK